MRLKIKKSVLERIIAHGRYEAPNEACGYLAGQDGVVSEHFELTNTDHDPEHFTMDPVQQFDAIRKMRARELKALAVYHSHPQSAALPSAEDLRLAFDPNIFYVIVSLVDAERPVRSFVVRQGEALEEPVEVVEEV